MKDGLGLNEEKAYLMERKFKPQKLKRSKIAMFVHLAYILKIIISEMVLKKL